MKFDFNNSTYAKFWGSRDARQALQIFVNDPAIIKRLPAFWKSQFAVDPLTTPRNNDGTAVFSAAQRTVPLENMLDWRTPLAETQARDKKGIESYTGTIPDFAARGYVEQAMEREARERMFEDYFGNDAQILSAYADDIQAMILEADSTMSHLAAQALSQGYVAYNYGSGITGNIYRAPIPDANFRSAGAVAWTDTANCKLLDQMEQIESDFRDASGYTGALKWQISKSDFQNYVLKNAQVIAYINDWRTVNDRAVVSGWNVNAQMFNEAFAVNEKISPIEIIEERQYNEGVAVNGWAANKAVLRPVGLAGQVKHADSLDRKMAEKYGSKAIDKVFANVDGLYILMNTTLNNGDFKEWHTDLFVSAVPVLEEFMYHNIISIDTAD